MKCPVCKDINLVMSDRQGIEIDYCPSCRGVWLDRGELDKIIERSSTSHQSNQNQSHYKEAHTNTHTNSYHNPSHQGYHKKKKEGFLSEIFDFDF